MLATVITIVSLALAVLGIAISIYYGFKTLRQSKRELRWSTEAIPLLPQDVESYRSVVQVTIDGKQVHHPYLMRLRIKNTGKLDLESTMFDKGRPLVFQLAGLKFYHVIESGSPNVTATSHTIALGPELLPSGQSWVISFITEDQPEVRLADSYLANVEIHDDTPPRVTQADVHRFDLRTSYNVALASALIALIGIIAALLLRS